jgi:hypothetical protein
MVTIFLKTPSPRPKTNPGNREPPTSSAHCKPRPPAANSVQYTKDIRDEKFARAYAHVYDHYFGAGLSAYA